MTGRTEVMAPGEPPRRSASRTTTPASEAETVYRYTDEHGKLAYEVVRRPGKKFLQRRPGPDGKPIYNLDGVERVPYRLRELRRAIDDGAEGVLVVEGEGDVESARSVGLVATTNAGGASSPWPPEWGRHFAGAPRVYVVADNDEPGRLAARTRAELLAGWVPDVQLVSALPDVGEKGDLSDFLAILGEQGLSVDEQRERVWSALERQGETVPHPSAPGQSGNGGPGGDVAKRGRSRRGVSSPSAAGSDATTTEPSAPRREKSSDSVAARLLAFIGEQHEDGSLELFHDGSGDCYATLPAETGPGKLTFPVASEVLRRRVTGGFYKARGEKPLRGCPVTKATWSDVVGRLEVQAYQGPEMEVAYRVARHCGEHGDAVFIDLGDRTGSVVEIDRNGWRVPDSAPVRFRRSASLRPLPEPTPGGDIGLLRRYLHVDDEAYPLVLTWILGALGARSPYFVLILHGEQGSAKTTSARVCRGLVDPSKALLRALSKDERDLAVAANNNYVLGFDNLSGIDSGISDALCRIANGEGYGSRALYSDRDEVVFDGARPIVMTGISVSARNGDILDRSLVVECLRIEDGRRQDERTLRSNFEQDHPSIFGGLLDAMVAGIAGEGGVKLERPPRMVDSARFAIAAEPRLGIPAGSIAKALDVSRSSAVDAAIEGSPFASAIVALVLTEGREFSGTHMDLLDVLARRRGDEQPIPKGWPTSPRAASDALRRVAPALRRVGISVEYPGPSGKSRARLVEIKANPEAGTS